MRESQSDRHATSEHIPPWGIVIIASFVSFLFGVFFSAKFMRPGNPKTMEQTSHIESQAKPELERVAQIDDPELIRKWDEDSAKIRLERFGSSAEPPGYRSRGYGGGYIDSETRRVAKDVYDFVNDPPDRVYEIEITPR